MSKLGKRESAAKEFCERVREASYPVPFRVIWKRSRMWGYCPHVKTTGGESLAYVNGCGFDKLSAALAEVLYWLPDSFGGPKDIRATSCAGLPAVQEACIKHGFELVQVYSGESEDGFTIQPVGMAEAE